MISTVKTKGGVSIVGRLSINLANSQKLIHKRSIAFIMLTVFTICFIAIWYLSFPAAEWGLIYQNIAFNVEIESKEDITLLREIQFKFMVEYTGSDSDMATRIPETVVIDINNITGSPFTFGAIEFTEPGVFEYRVSQVVAEHLSTNESGRWYMDESVFYITIHVEESGGELLAHTSITRYSESVENIVFVNRYESLEVGTIAMLFPDEVLAEIVANQLDVTIDTVVTRATLLLIRSLEGSSSNAPRATIMNITGIEYLTNLTYLRLHNNRIVNLSPLENLTYLEELSLTHNEISDLRPLSNLTALRILRLTGNEIEDLTPLSNLTKLTVLSLATNKISDLAPLQNLTNLTELGLAGNEISDLSPISNMINIEQLGLGWNLIEDLTPLLNLTSLTSLLLRNNLITDLSPLANMSYLEVLIIQENRINDLTPLSKLINLRRFNIDSNEIVDITPLSNLLNLGVLSLERNLITDITPLIGFSRLHSLNLSDNLITDFSGLSNLSTLRLLVLDGEHESYDILCTLVADIRQVGKNLTVYFGVPRQNLVCE